MKKFFAFLSAALFIAACTPKEDPEVTFMLTNDNVEVAGLTSDALVVVDAAAQKVAIEVAYVDKAELAALQVNFVGVPSDVTVENFTFDFSTGATKEVTVSQNGAVDTYVFSASAAKPEPKFLTLALATAKAGEDEEGNTITVLGTPVAVAGGTAKFKGSDDLTKLAVVYTVSPANAKVYTTVDGQEVEVANEAVLDFSDKMNGVDLVVKCEGESATQNVKIVTTGFSSVKRLWGRYVKPESVDANWYDLAATGIGGAGNYRNVAIDAKYVYLPKAGGPEVNVIDVKTGEFVKQLNCEGISGGVHPTSSVQVADNNGSSVVLVAPLVNAKDSHLKIYAWTDLDAAPTVALDYVLPEAYRFGDKFQLEGNWQKGRLIFVSYAGAADRTAAIFDITNGVINAEPALVKIGNVGKAGNSIGGLYRYSDTEYIWMGSGDLWATYTVSGNTFTQKTQCADGGRFSHPMHDAHFITFNDQKYLVYARLLNGYQDGAIRFQEINVDSLDEAMNSADVTTDKQFALGDPTKAQVTADKNGNGCGACDVYQAADGTTYVVGFVTGAGLSVFELVK